MTAPDPPPPAPGPPLQPPLAPAPGAAAEPGAGAEEGERARAAALYAVLVLFLATALLAAIAMLRGQGQEEGPPPPAPGDPYVHDPLAGLPAGPAALDPTILVRAPLPPLRDGFYPCTECHEPDADDLRPRTLTIEHADLVLRHGPAARWCFDCHAPLARDQLHLADGTPLDLRDAPRLCGQCHGAVYREWQEGLHGLRTGYWSGARRELSCVHCHDPHVPRFQPVTPLPAPVRPGAR